VLLASLKDVGGELRQLQTDTQGDNNNEEILLPHSCDDHEAMWNLKIWKLEKVAEALKQVLRQEKQQYDRSRTAFRRASVHTLRVQLS
jgi:hypothetical protein